MKQHIIYVRFLPANLDEYDILVEDATLELYDYPLDYELEEGGTYYHDPSIPEGNITWQYCAVEVDYQFPGINYEIIAELYIPEEDEGGLKSSSTYNREQFIALLVDEALIITRNLDEEKREDVLLKRPSKWTPSGNIYAYDNIIDNLTPGVINDGQIPVWGAKVRARKWFITKIGFTSSNGSFQTGQFRRAVNYSIKWETTEYDIRNGASIQAYYNGPKRRYAWNLEISGGKSLRYATIHRAADRYHFRNIGGLKRPNVWRKLKINYKDSEGTGVNWGNNWQAFMPGSVLWPNIKIWGKNNNGDYRPTDQVYSTTIHEIAHASHIELMGIQFGTVTKQLRESWADAVEWYITRIEYRTHLGVGNYDDPVHHILGAHKQNWTSSSNNDYTPLFIDLVDTYNQSLRRGTQPTNRCPDGGTFDGANCYVGTPPSGESAFVYADNFYYTPVGCCSCPLPGSGFDNVNCYVMDIPDNSIGFIWNNRWYLTPAGNTNYPYDQVSGYTMHSIESNILKQSYGLTSLSNKLKANRPSGMTNKHIDLLLSHF